MTRNTLDFTDAKQSGRVLILGTDDRVTLAVARSLGRRGLTVHLGWAATDSLTARSRYVSKTHAISPYSPVDLRWKEELLRLLREESYDLVIPCNDSTLVPLASHRADFASFPQIQLLPEEVFSVVSSKFRTLEVARAAGVCVPEGRIVDGSAKVDQLIAEFGLPLVLKPQSSVTTSTTGVAHVVRRAPDREAVQETLAAVGSGQILVQRNFRGRGVGIEMLVHEGEILFAFQHARIHETVEWGSSYRKSVPVNGELRAAAAKLMQRIGYTGVAMAEFIVDPDSGRWVFLEINGRFWGSLPLAVAAGADFPRFLYEMCVEGRREFQPDYRLHVRCRNLMLDLGWLRSQSARTRWGKALLPFQALSEILSGLWHRDHLDNFSLDDPRPQWFELSKLASRGWSKAISLVTRKGDRDARAADVSAAPSLGTFSHAPTR